MERIINKTFFTLLTIIFFGFFSFLSGFAVDPPTAVDDFAITNEDLQLPIDVLENDTDPQGNIDPTTVQIVGPAAHGTISVNPFSGLVIYTPEPNYNGTDYFIYEVCDTDGLCDQAFVSITTNPINDTIIAVDDYYSTHGNKPVTYNMLNNDSDSLDQMGNLDPGSLSIIRSPQNGFISIDPFTSEVTYTPKEGFYGNDLYVYEICDDGYPLPSTCDRATVMITVDYESGDPVQVPDGFSPNRDGVNDYFVIPGIEKFPGNELLVYNRWGSKVYSAKGYEHSWDGKSNNNMAFGEPLAVGTYFYVLTLANGTDAITGYVYINH